MNDTTMNVELDFAKFLERVREEWGTYGVPPKSIEEYVTGEAIQRIDDELRGKVEAKLERMIDETTAAVVKEQIGKRIEERLSRTFQPMKYGEPDGGPLSLFDLIDYEIEKQSKVRAKGSTYGAKSTLEELIERQVLHTYHADMSKAVANAKEMVTKALEAEGAKFIASAVQDLHKKVGAKK